MLKHMLSFEKFLNFIRPLGKSAYKMYDLLGFKLLTRLRLGFHHLSKHKFWHNFSDLVNSFCSCSLETESTLHFPLRYQNDATLRIALSTDLNDLKNINEAIMSLNESDLLHVIVHGNKNFDSSMDIRILISTFKFIEGAERFDQPFFNCY